MSKLFSVEDSETGYAIFINPDNIGVVFQTMQQKDGVVTDKLITVISLLNGNVATPESLEVVVGKIKAA